MLDGRVAFRKNRAGQNALEVDCQKTRSRERWFPLPLSPFCRYDRYFFFPPLPGAY